jgi:hypothetical protein
MERTTRVFDVQIARSGLTADRDVPLGKLVVIADSFEEASTAAVDEANRRWKLLNNRRWKLLNPASAAGDGAEAEPFTFTRSYVTEMTVVREVASVHADVDKAG